MTDRSPIDSKRTTPSIAAAEHPTGHDLVAVDAWLPGSAPTDAAIELTTGPRYRTRFWRCRACGIERERPAEFRTVCPGGGPRPLVTDGGTSPDDEWDHGARLTDLGVQFLTVGAGYRVVDDDGSDYLVDIEAETCNCEAHERTGADCEHIRRAERTVRRGELPGPDGWFVR